MKKSVTSTGRFLDVLAELFPDSSRTTLRQMLADDRVRLNGEVVRDARREVEIGDVLEVGQRSSRILLPPELQLLHEDDDVLVVLKANGLLTVATEREREATAQAYLNAYLKEKREDRVHVVHRLDRETSGVLVFAKHFAAREALKDQFAEHDVDRIYVAIVEGQLDPPSGTFESHLVEMKDLRMASVDRPRADSRRAITHYRTIRATAQFSMLEVTLETGRKNQIRTHLAEAGHPIVGDRLYGATTNPIGRLGLHAKLLGFRHPRTGEKMSFTAPIPSSFRTLLPKAN